MGVLLLLGLTGQADRDGCSLVQLSLLFAICLMTCAVSVAALGYYSYRITEKDERVNPFPNSLMSMCSRDTLTYTS